MFKLSFSWYLSLEQRPFTSEFLTQSVAERLIKCKGVLIPKPDIQDDKDKELVNKLVSEIPNLIQDINSQNLNSYIKKIINFSFDANKYFNDSEPWAVKKENPERMQTILFTIVEQIKNISLLLNPIMPDSTSKILDILNIKKEDRFIKNINNNNIFDHDKELNKLEILFKKID